MAIHVANFVQRPVLAGVVLDPETITIRQKMDATTETRVQEDSGIPNSADFPTLKEYLTLEEAAGFLLQHLDQTYIITRST